MTGPDERVRIRNLRVPESLLGRADAFGGRADGDCRVVDVDLAGGRLNPASGEPALVLDAAGWMGLAALVEPHCHLDKCHTIGRLDDVGSGLAGAGERMKADKARWTHEDVLARAGQGLEDLRRSGCALVRTHVDWSSGADPTAIPVAWGALGELVTQVRPEMTLQRAPLVSLEDLDDDDFFVTVLDAVERAEGVLGVFVLGQSRLDERLGRLFDRVATHSLMLDFHVDESLDASLSGLDAIARARLASGHRGPVLCGHACALSSQAAPTVAQTLSRVAEAGIALAALPSTNLYLQDRGAGTPVRRGVTRVQEMDAAGIEVVFGTDNVGDAYCPLGRHDPLFSLELAALVAHLDPPYGPWLPAVSTRAAAALGQAPVPLDGAPAHQVLLVESTSTADLARTRSRVRLDRWAADAATRTVQRHNGGSLHE